jgi:hypothetical protein
LLNKYVINISNLLPDSTTLQNVWSYAPGNNNWWFGVGASASITLSDRRTAAGLIDSGGTASGFGGNNVDLNDLPQGVPYLPAGSFDIRVGGGRFDLGVSGMWIDGDTFPFLTYILGDNSDIMYRMLGFDMRYAILREGAFFNGASPSLFIQAGYFFSWMQLGFAGGSETIGIDFRTDSYLLALQVSKEFPIFKPFIGMKMVASKTDSAFSWDTSRPVKLKGNEYASGLSYYSGANDGDTFLYFSLYGGFGLTFIFPHFITASFSYNVITEHFGLSLSARLLLRGAETKR